MTFTNGSEAYLEHHGILGQKWGVKNGPPYPLKGGSYTATEQKAIKAARRNKYSRYNKKHYDNVLEKGTSLKTLSYDPNRTSEGDMFYAVHDKIDEHHYKAFFNKKVPQPIFDEHGNNVGTGVYRKFSIENKLVKDMKVASEDSGAKAFTELYSKDRDFYNFVTDPDRLRSRFEEGIHKVSPGYEKARNTMDRMRDPKYVPTDKDLKDVYRIFNHSIPSDANGDARKAADVTRQRAKFFNQLKKDGYSAVLDTNDALYNTVQAKEPIIVFDMEGLIKVGSTRTTGKDVAVSKVINTTRHLVGK